MCVWRFMRGIAGELGKVVELIPLEKWWYVAAMRFYLEVVVIALRYLWK